MGVSVTTHAITKPGSRNIGPPYSQPQCPEGNCRCLKNSSPFLTESSGVLAGGSSGRFCHGQRLFIPPKLANLQVVSLRNTCQQGFEAMPWLSHRSQDNAMSADLSHLGDAIGCSQYGQAA